MEMNNTKQIVWSELAENDFSAILEYLSNIWSIKVANKFIDILDMLISQIAKNPQQFPIINHKEKIRKCVISKHNSLYYRINENKIEILRIYDNRQDPNSLKFY